MTDLAASNNFWASRPPASAPDKAVTVASDEFRSRRFHYLRSALARSTNPTLSRTRQRSMLCARSTGAPACSGTGVHVGVRKFSTTRACDWHPSRLGKSSIRDVCWALAQTRTIMWNVTESAATTKISSMLERA